MPRQPIATLTPAEFMLSRDHSNPDIQAYHTIVDSILDQLTFLCNEEPNLAKFRNGVIDILIEFDTQPTEH
jgi:hypothetical protein